MLTADFHTITEKDLEDLVQDKVSEGETLEYKEQQNLGPVEAKLEFLKDISSFANAKGGDLILGVGEDDDHKPSGTVALKAFNFDEWQRQITDISRKHLEPPLLGLQFKEIPLKNGGFAMVIRVPKPWAGPHMVKLLDDNRFYIRVGTQKKAMSVPELRSAFMLSESVAQKMRNFRTERLSKISIHETPVSMLQSAYIVIHVIPFASFSQNLDVHLHRLIKSSPSWLRPISRPYQWGPGTFNFEGVIAQSYESGRLTTNSYVQVFRNGCIEAVDSHLLQPINERRAFLDSDELAIAEAMKYYLEGLFELDVAPPYFAMLSLINVNGYVAAYGRTGRSAPQNVNRDHLIFPEEIVNTQETDCAKLLKRSFDTLWQTCGLVGSPNYDETGDLNRYALINR